MDAELYKAATEGNVEYLPEIPSSGGALEDGKYLSKTHQNDNILHLAARAGHASFIEKALKSLTSSAVLLCHQENKDGDTPLHVAARRGDLEVVQLLGPSMNQHQSVREEGATTAGIEPSSSTAHQRPEIEEVSGADQEWQRKNLEGDTALHAALRNGHDEVSRYLLKSDPNMACSTTDIGESLLYLAAKSCCEGVIMDILSSNVQYSTQGPTRQNPLQYITRGPVRQNALHATKDCSKNVIVRLYEDRPQLFKEFDEHGKAAIHYAVEENNSNWIIWMLDCDKSLAYLPDAKGFTPLLRAADRGQWQICQRILEMCPESIQARNKDGQNVLHLWVMYPDSKVFLKISQIRQLVNERDLNGNTPLHLAVKNRQYEKERFLVSISSVDLRATNKEGLTALAMCGSDWKFSLKQRKIEEEGKMDSELFNAAKKGNESYLQEDRQNTNQQNFLSRTHQNNNILHIAASYKHEPFIEAALKRFPILANQVNSQGDTPLHCAAKFGHLEVVKLLIEGPNYKPTNQNQVTLNIETNSSVAYEREAEEGLGAYQKDVQYPPLWQVKNLDGDTALDEALKNRHEDVSLYLLEKDPEVACFVNGVGESLLYLAVESGCKNVVEKILDLDLPYSVQGPHGQNASHVSRDRRKNFGISKDITHLLRERRPEIFKEVDDCGKTPIHYAVEDPVEEGYNWLFILNMLSRDPSLAHLPDAEGFTPLLRAATRGNFGICESILEKCPESIEARNKDGQNVLHLCRSSKYSDYRSFFKISEISHLINQCDFQGNTPLHVAVKNREFEKARLLLYISNVEVRAINKEGLSALDICESNSKLDIQDYKQRYMRRLLLQRGAESGRRPNKFKNLGESQPIVSPEDLNLRANTLIVVATLFVTITFAAAFTMPGGFSSSDKTLGVAVLIKKVAFQIFILSDTFAMCCSVITVFSLIYAIAKNKEISVEVMDLSHRLLTIALYGTLVAFATALYSITAPEALWLSIIICIMASIVPFLLQHNVIRMAATGILRSPSPIRDFFCQLLPRVLFPLWVPLCLVLLGVIPLLMVLWFVLVMLPFPALRRWSRKVGINYRVRRLLGRLVRVGYRILHSLVDVWVWLFGTVWEEV